ncbi:MAG TPA: hypothetical protein VGH28_29190 [Polyangiaceae bacterium]|jgi:hypothetical protein
MKRILVGLLVLTAACSRQREHGTSLTSVELEAGPSAQQSVADLSRSWNRAISQRDLSLLGPVYGADVDFYGAPLRRDQVVQVLSDAFTKDPSFTQTVLDVKATSPTRVEVKREWIRFGKKHKGVTWLEGKQEDDRWVVVGEGDSSSAERNKSRGPSGPSVPFCDDLAQRIALSTPEATALQAGPPGHVDAKLVLGPPEFPAFAIAMTSQANGKPVTVAWYDVEPCFLYSPAPNVKAAPGVCVPPGNASGAVTDVFTGHVLTAEPKLLVQMSKCHAR